MNDESRLGDNLNKNYRNDSSTGDANVIKRPMFKDLAGMSGVIEELKRRVVVPLCHPQLLPHYEVNPTAGILSLGPPGCGKTRLAHAIANESGVPLHKVSATELVSGVSGASEENIRELFSKARRTSPSIVFIDEIDVIASKRDNSKRDMEKRIVTQLLTSMDPVEDEDGSEFSDRRRGSVLVIGATNRPDDLDPALRRPGRFDREIMLGIPDEAARVEILSVVTCNLKVKGTLDLAKLARLTPGFVGADLRELAKEAASVALDRTLVKRKVELSKEQKDWVRQPWSVEEMENLFVTMDNFEEAVERVQPSLKREGFSTIPNIKWDDVGGLHLLRQEFDRYIVRCIKLSKYFENYKGNLDPGFLLYGPPGCGKTPIAKAVANEAGANFIHIKGPELLNKYVGESESAVRSIFSRARTCSPCIIFFDEVHALTRKRGQEEGSVVERVLDQLLIELDGSEQRRGVYVIGATNSPLHTPDERGMILKALARELPIDADVDLIALGKDSRCDNFSGADLSCLIHEAMMAAVDDQLPSCAIESWAIKRVNFTTALEKITPSVSAKQIRHYKRLSKRFKAK